MPLDAAFTIAVVCEADADRDIACCLADRVLCSEVDWITHEIIDTYRLYRGFPPGESYLRWGSVRRLGKRYELGVKAHGRFRDEPGDEDALTARRALLLLLLHADPPPDAVLLTRDADSRPNRRRGLEQARDDRKWHFRVIIGVANTKRECWALNGFDPRDKTEAEQLESESRQLGFDPRTSAHQLRDRKDHEPRSAKRVLAALVGADYDRQRACWNTCDLATLQGRGTETGLTAYLDELRERLVPLFRGSASVLR